MSSCQNEGQEAIRPKDAYALLSHVVDSAGKDPTCVCVPLSHIGQLGAGIHTAPETVTVPTSGDASLETLEVLPLPLDEEEEYFMMHATWVPTKTQPPAHCNGYEMAAWMRNEALTHPKEPLTCADTPLQPKR
jgi:hypothetical protein